MPSQHPARPIENTNTPEGIAMWNTPATHINVLIWLAEPLLRAGVRATLGATGRLGIVEGLQATSEDAQVVVTDWSSGLLFVQRDDNPDLPRLPLRARVLVICAQAREYPVAFALRAGVHGVVRANCTSEELVEAVRSLAQGFTYVCPDLAGRIGPKPPREELTAREAEVLELVARGLCNKQIARQLDIAVGTVKTHVKGVLGKLGASSRTEAASIATGKGIVGVPGFRERRDDMPSSLALARGPTAWTPESPAIAGTA